jgi:hypothetical protein
VGVPPAPTDLQALLLALIVLGEAVPSPDCATAIANDQLSTQGRAWRAVREPSNYESGGQEFESLRARQYVIDFDSEFLRDFRPLTVGLFGAAPGQHPRIFTVIAARLNPLILVCEESPIVGGELFGNCRSARRLSSLRARKPTHHLLDCRLFFLRHPAAFD